MLSGVAAGMLCLGGETERETDVNEHSGLHSSTTQNSAALVRIGQPFRNSTSVALTNFCRADNSEHRNRNKTLRMN